MPGIALNSTVISPRRLPSGSKMVSWGSRLAGPYGSSSWLSVAMSEACPGVPGAEGLPPLSARLWEMKRPHVCVRSLGLKSSFFLHD